MQHLVLQREHAPYWFSLRSNPPFCPPAFVWHPAGLSFLGWSALLCPRPSRLLENPNYSRVLFSGNTEQSAAVVPTSVFAIEAGWAATEAAFELTSG
jgi:hypothetical protein